jgi:hypothetical protein
MKAIKVLRAAGKTFANYGNEDYAKSKTNSFLRRCGTKLDDGPDQDIPHEIIKAVVYAMLDADSELLFWANLGKEEMG